MTDFIKEIKYDCGCLYRFKVGTDYGLGGVDTVKFCDKHMNEYMTFYEFEQTLGERWTIEYQRKKFIERYGERKEI